MNEVPSGFTWDEAAITYDAWGISQDGHDHHGQWMPLTFVSLGDYKAPVMIYVLAGIFRLAGLHLMAIRYISVVAGLGLVLCVYRLANIWWPEHKMAGGIAACIMAVSPWSIELSRVGFEANLALTCVTAAGLALYAARGKPRRLLLAAVLGIVAFYTYQSMKVVVPLLLIPLGVRLLGRKNKGWVAGAGILLLLGMLPYLFAFPAEAGNRARQVLLWYSGTNNLWQQLGRNLLVHVSPDFLIHGRQANLRQGVPGFGVLFITDLPLFLYGFWQLWTTQKKLAGYLTWWLLAGILPSVVAIDAPHALRAAAILPVLTLVTTYGLMALTRFTFPMVWLIYFVVYGLSVGLFASVYFGRYARVSAADFQYGYRQVIAVTQTYRQRADKIYMTAAYGEPYIFTLLYSRIAPEEFLAGGLANYRFGPITWPDKSRNTLYLATPREIPPGDQAVVVTIPYPDGEGSAWVVAYHP